MGLITSLWNLLQKGHEVSDPAKWKAHQITANAVGGVLLAIAGVLKAKGISLPVSNDDALLIGGAVVAVFNIVWTVITSKKAGLGAAPTAEQLAADAARDSIIAAHKARLSAGSDA